MYAGTLSSVHGGSSVARSEEPVRQGGRKSGRRAIRDLVVSRLPRTNSSVATGRWSVRRRRPPLVLITKRTDYQAHAMWWKTIRKAGPMEIGRRSVACDGARQPRGWTRFPTWTYAQAQEAVSFPI